MKSRKVRKQKIDKNAMLLDCNMLKTKNTNIKTSLNKT